MTPPLTDRPSKLSKLLILKSNIDDSLRTIKSSLGIQNTLKLTDFLMKFQIGPFNNGIAACSVLFDCSVWKCK